MLDANVKTQLKGYLANVTHPIEIIASTDDSDSSRELQSLLNDIVEQSDKISLRQSDDPTTRKPSFAINRVGVYFFSFRRDSAPFRTK